MSKEKEYVLVKDLVIPKGTVFGAASTKVERFGPGHIEAFIGLSKNSCGSISYCVDADTVEDQNELDDFFLELKR